MKCLKSLIVLLALLPSFANAQNGSEPDGCCVLSLENEIQYMPGRYSQGSWFAAERTGSGLFLDSVQASRDVNVTAATLYTFNRRGEPLWLLATAALSPKTTTDVWANRFDQFSATSLDARGGPCPNCPQIAPTVQESEWGELRIIWTSPYSANVFVGGVQTAALAPSDLQFGLSVYELLQGEWRGTERAAGFPSSPETRSHQCTVTISPGENLAPANIWRAETPRARSVPSQNARWLQFTSSAPDAGDAAGACLGWNQRFGNGIAVEPDGATVMPRLGTGSTEEIRLPNNQFGQQGALQGYTMLEAGSVTVVWLQSPNEIIAWTRSNFDNRRVRYESRLTRVTRL